MFEVAKKFSNQHVFFDRMKEILGVRSDIAVARHLGVTQSNISSMRRGSRPMSEALLNNASKETQIPIPVLKSWMS